MPGHDRNWTGQMRRDWILSWSSRFLKVELVKGDEMMERDKYVRIIAITLLAAGGFAVRATAQDQSKCKSVHADLVELRNTTACKPGDTVCFLGQVDGNHGLRGTTYFHGESAAPGPSTSPD